VPEKVWNTFRLGVTALEEGHSVDVFLMSAGVKAPEIDHEEFNTHGLMMKFANKGSHLHCCGTCLDFHDLPETELRPKCTMSDLLGIIERTDRLVSVG
jgi:sulfur relay (sulfurtransferase) complex TusBCD TusD component (DsrE family)